MIKSEDLRAALVETLGVGVLDGNEKLHQYGFNSMMFVEVIGDLEDRFELDIDLEALDSIDEDTTVDSFITLLADAIS